MKSTFLTFGILFVSLFLVACSPSPETTNTTDNTASPNNVPVDQSQEPIEGGAATGAMLVGSNAIYMNSQMPGTEINVTTLQLQEPGYVVIHRNENGKVGEVIGVSDLLSPDTVEATLTLDEAVADGDQLFAMLHTDNGNQVYDDPQTDAPILDDITNSPIQMEFEVSETADQEPIVMP